MAMCRCKDCARRLGVAPIPPHELCGVVCRCTRGDVRGLVPAGQCAGGRTRGARRGARAQPLREDGEGEPPPPGLRTAPGKLPFRNSLSQKNEGARLPVQAIRVRGRRWRAPPSPSSRTPRAGEMDEGGGCIGEGGEGAGSPFATSAPRPVALPVCWQGMG